MERKVQKLLITTGLVIGAVVAMLPLTSYAAVSGPAAGSIYNCGERTDNTLGVVGQSGEPCATGEGTLAVNVLINSTLEMDAAATKDVQIEVASNQVKTGTLVASVRSARNYTISISAEEPRLIAESDPDGIIGIPSKSQIQAGTSAWGMKKFGATDYSAVTQIPTVFYEGTANADFVPTSFEVGVSTSSTLPTDTYSTDVTITAATKL